MKNIISVILSILMIAGVMSLTAFAGDYTADDLGEYGQHTVALDAKKTPTIDGVINEGEYAYSESVAKDTTIYGTDNVTATRYHFSYDDTNLYIGGVVEDASEHVNYVNSLWAYISGDTTDLDNAWRIYMTRANGNMVEHWYVDDSVRSDNLWNPIDSANGDARKHGMGDRRYEFKQSFADGVYNYEISLNRADWGITGDKILVAMAVKSSDGMDIYGFRSEELAATSLGLSSNADYSEYGVYMHVLELEATSETATNVGAAPDVEPPAETEPVETEPQDTTPSDAEPTDWSVMELEEFGQQHWTIEGKTDEAPIADGVVDDGEYTLEIKDMDPFMDNSDDRFFCIDPQALDVESFSLYFSYDDEYIYIGAEVTETEVLDGEDITFYLSCNPKDFLDGVYVGYVFGGAPNTSEAEAFNTAVDGNTITYELVIRRTFLADYIGADDVEDITEFSFLLIMGDDRDIENYPDLWPEMWFGTIVPKFSGLASSKEAAAAEGKLWGLARDGRRFPHVMTLGDAPETEPQETTPPETTPAETTPAETTPADTTPTETAPIETEPTVEKGCGASVAAIAVALVAALGTCVTFINKKR